MNYTLKPRDPANAPRSYILSVITSLDEHNASEVVKDTEQSRELIKKLVWKLQPPELRQRMVDAMEMWNKEDKSSLKSFQIRLARLRRMFTPERWPAKSLVLKRRKYFSIKLPTARGKISDKLKTDLVQKNVKGTKNLTF